MSAAITGYSSERPAGSIVTSTAGARSSEAPKVSLSVLAAGFLAFLCAGGGRRRPAGREHRQRRHAATPQRRAQRGRRATRRP